MEARSADAEVRSHKPVETDHGRERRVRRCSRLRQDSVGDLLLDHHHGSRDALSAIDEHPENGTRQIVRQIAGNDDSLHAVLAGGPAEVEVQRVALYERNAVDVPVLLSKCADDPRVVLDAHDPSRRRCQPERDGAEARPDLDYDLVLGGADGIHDLAGHVRIDEKILPPVPGGRQPVLLEHRSCRSGVQARSRHLASLVTNARSAPGRRAVVARPLSLPLP